MGKLGPRLSSKKKAKRWPKGQSSNSNPTTKKHRKQATCMFFKEFTGTGLMVEDLQKHDAIQGIQPRFENLDIDKDHEVEVESATEGTVNTFDTFASNYSNCTNISFSRFLNHFQSDSLLHKEMLAVLSAVTEVIKQNDGNESSTEYFAALMSTLEAVETDTSVAATLSLLGMGLRTVPKNVLNVQFGAASQIFLQILSKYVETDNFLILRHCIGCISLLLRAQEAATWSNTSTMRVVDAILTFCVHTKPKLRKAAQHCICAVLKASDIMRSENPPPYHPAASQVAKHCVTQLNAVFEAGGITTILHTLSLLKDITHQLPKSYVKIICEGLLRIMSLKNVLVTSCCLQTLHGLFVTRPSEMTLPSQRNAQIITALYDYQPPVSDTQLTLAWLAVMQEAHCNLVQNSLNICAAIIPRILERCIELWLSDKNEIISGTSHTIKTLLQDCVAVLCTNEKQEKEFRFILDQVISNMHKAMNYQYLEAWYHVLHLIATLFQTIGKTKNPLLLDVIKTLAGLRESYKFIYNADAEYAIGAAIRSMGPRIVLQTLPLKGDNDTILLERSWLLSLFKDCITHGSLSFFLEELLPLIAICEKKSKELQGGKAYEQIILLVWAILPSLCNDADDVKDNFKNIAKMLGTIISENKDLRVLAMASLRKLITKATEKNSEEDIAQLARFAKNYLPLLFNVYTTKASGSNEDGQRLSAFDTIKVYLTISSKELANELFDRALFKLDQPNANDFFRECVYDLIRVLIEYTDIDKLKQYYDICIPFLKDNTKHKEQKKAYRFLEGVCGSEKDVCKNFVLQHRNDIQKMLISSAVTVIKTSRGPRIRCLIEVVKIHPQLEKTKFLQAIVPEAVLCVKDVNERCRTSAYQLLNVIAEKFLGNAEHFKEYINMVMVGIGGEQKYCSATLLALASITYHYNGSLGIDTVKEILTHACTLATNNIREIVESAISYIKVYIRVMPSPIITSTLTQIMIAFSEMQDDCKRHFRQKVRIIFSKLIRKYGVGTISSLIPLSDLILHKRLKNIYKTEENKKKKKQLKNMKKLQDDEDSEFSTKRRPKTIEDILADSEEEFCNMEQDDARKNKKRTSRKEAWIQENEENIVDLIDPAAARSITTTLPGSTNMKIPEKKPKDHGFKTAPDGRLIITDRDENYSDIEVTKKEKLPFSQNESENDDYEDEEDAKSTLSSKKVSRKRKYAENLDAMSSNSYSTSKYQAGGSGIHRSLKLRKMEYSPGSEYRATKAKGDIKKKGKPDPYAYLPLTRSALNKRKKKKNASKYQNIVSGAKKGAQTGTKNKKKFNY